MRSTQLFSIAGAAIAVVQATSGAETINAPVWEANSTASWTRLATCDNPSYTNPEIDATTLSTTVVFPNSTAILTSTPVLSTPPNATTSLPAEATGAAFPRQMQSSVVGLLGFCIMSLIMF